VAAKEAYVKRMPDAELVVIPNARHATPLERLRMFNETVRHFLGRQG
jgi:3-oxoadipate enol-lactonase